MENSLCAYFKPEIRKSGQDLFLKDVVSLSIASDAQIQAFIKTGTGSRVGFLAEKISSRCFSATCTCPVASKGSFCKHIWATLLKVEQKYPDFLENKQDIEIETTTNKPKADAYQNKQAEFKKNQYEKQKQYAKQKRIEQKKKRNPEPLPSYPTEVQKALDYFSDNGFPLESELTLEALKLAKKKLSRIFHPDLGGSHAEIVILNQQVEVLISFIQK